MLAINANIHNLMVARLSAMSTIASRLVTTSWIEYTTNRAMTNSFNLWCYLS